MYQIVVNEVVVGVEKLNLAQMMDIINRSEDKVRFVNVATKEVVA